MINIGQNLRCKGTVFWEINNTKKEKQRGNSFPRCKLLANYIFTASNTLQAEKPTIPFFKHI